MEEFITPIVKVTKGTQVLSFYTIPEFEEWKSSVDTAKSWKIKYYKGYLFRRFSCIFTRCGNLCGVGGHAKLCYKRFCLDMWREIVENTCNEHISRNCFLSAVLVQVQFEISIVPFSGRL